jgi:carbamoyl-phosphate synthase small subunit
MKKALLILEDGEVFEGVSFGAEGEVFGEAVFNTSMTGYQEILTDPSYAGQLICMTYPSIGNYGTNPEDTESQKPFCRGFIVKKLCRIPSHFRSTKSLDTLLKEQNIPGIEGVDTRRLTLHLRIRGAMRAGLSTKTLDPKNLLEKVKKSPSIDEEDLVGTVTTPKPYFWNPEEKQSVTAHKVAVVDFGVKTNILRLLRHYFKEVQVFPGFVQAKEILASKADGIFLSNGPGDPARVTSGIQMVKEVLGQKPLFGVCLGHQILALAIGAKTYKLKFGHRGGNQPVQCFQRKKIEITAQNHGYAVDAKSLEKLSSGLEAQVTHVNLNDATVAGLRIPSKNAFSVQYHPESSPGPHDSRYLFQDFVNLIEKGSFHA